MVMRMNLPNYFLADLPPEATLTPAIISEAAQALKRNREKYLLERSTQSLVRTLSELGASWLDPEYSFRKLALSADPKNTGFSSATLAAGLDAFFQQITTENLQNLLSQELGHTRRLDELCATSTEQKQERAAVAHGPEFLVHVVPGNIPSAALSSMVLGLLVRSAQFIKCATGAALVPRLFAHSLYEVEPKLGSCLELAEWPGGQADLEAALFAEADCVTATGGDEALASIRHRLPVHVRFVGYGHRVSFAYVTGEMLSGFNVNRLVELAASDVVAWNQLGCLSPHLIYVERSGRLTVQEFAEKLADELDRREEAEPRGAISDVTAATIASRRGFYEVRAAHTEETRQWCSDQSTAWTVVYEADPRFQLSCLHRFVYVKGVSSVQEALQAADSVRGRVSTVGLAATEDRAQALAMTLARWGVTRICPLGQMQRPPLTWRHDGRPALGDLVTWTDWEYSA
jgi:hypothetical protein